MSAGRGDLVGRLLYEVLADIWRQGDHRYWLRRADTYAAVGNARCDEIAQACRNRASRPDFADQQLQDLLEDLLRERPAA